MPSAWNLFVKNVYESKKKADPTYQFRQALKEAAPMWKKQGAGGAHMPMHTPKARKSGSKSKSKSKKSKSSKKKRSTRRKSSRKH